MTKHSQTQSKNFQNKKKYFNRELSWLEFNNRVMDYVFSILIHYSKESVFYPLYAQTRSVL